MFNPRCTPLMRTIALLGATVPFLEASAQSQSTTHSSPSVPSYGESTSVVAPIPDDGNANSLLSSDAALPAAQAAGGAAGGQSGGSSHRGLLNRLAFEAGGGFSGPSGDTSNYITWGGNFTIGGGLHFTDHLAGLLEYQFIDDKLPGALIAETGANGGNAHIWSLTLDPVYDVLPNHTNDVYATGGGGFYRKVTNFTDPSQYCDIFYCGIENRVVGHFSSNQGGWSVGGGYVHRMGGVYGDSKMKLFAEVRFLDVKTPAVTTEPNGLGTTSVAADTKLLPVTLGLRW